MATSVDWECFAAQIGGARQGFAHTQLASSELSWTLLLSQQMLQTRLSSHMICSQLTLDTVIPQLLPQLQKLGVTIVYKFHGQLLRSRNQSHQELMCILLYADDISLVCGDYDNLREAVAVIDPILSNGD